jgi:hypothetical protein
MVENNDYRLQLICLNQAIVRSIGCSHYTERVLVGEKFGQALAIYTVPQTR